MLSGSPSEVKQLQKTHEQVVKELYEAGWNPEFVKISVQEDGIKIKGSLTQINWSEIKFSLYVRGYSYDKKSKTFKKTHEDRSKELEF